MRACFHREIQAVRRIVDRLCVRNVGLPVPRLENTFFITERRLCGQNRGYAKPFPKDTVYDARASEMDASEGIFYRGTYAKTPYIQAGRVRHWLDSRGQREQQRGYGRNVQVRVPGRVFENRERIEHQHVGSSDFAEHFLQSFPYTHSTIPTI